MAVIVLAERIRDLGDRIGDRKGLHSVRVNDQWRICFAWRDGEAWDVEIDDYH